MAKLRRRKAKILSWLYKYFNCEKDIAKFGYRFENSKLFFNNFKNLTFKRISKVLPPSVLEKT
jgi:phospholipid N-methyltransferase